MSFEMDVLMNAFFGINSFSLSLFSNGLYRLIRFTRGVGGINARDGG